MSILIPLSVILPVIKPSLNATFAKQTKAFVHPDSFIRQSPTTAPSLPSLKFQGPEAQRTEEEKIREGFERLQTKIDSIKNLESSITEQEKQYKDNPKKTAVQLASSEALKSQLETSKAEIVTLKSQLGKNYTNLRNHLQKKANEGKTLQDPAVKVLVEGLHHLDSVLFTPTEEMLEALEESTDSQVLQALEALEEKRKPFKTLKEQLFNQQFEAIQSKATVLRESTDDAEKKTCRLELEAEREEIYRKLQETQKSFSTRCDNTDIELLNKNMAEVTLALYDPDKVNKILEEFQQNPEAHQTIRHYQDYKKTFIREKQLQEAITKQNKEIQDAPNDRDINIQMLVLFPEEMLAADLEAAMADEHNKCNGIIEAGKEKLVDLKYNLRSVLEERSEKRELLAGNVDEAILDKKTDFLKLPLEDDYNLLQKLQGQSGTLLATEDRQKVVEAPTTIQLGWKKNYTRNTKPSSSLHIPTKQGTEPYAD